MARTAFCMSRNSLRSFSRIWASFSKVDFVTTLGITATDASGPNRRFSVLSSSVEASAVEEPLPPFVGLVFKRVAATAPSEPPPSSSSRSSAPDANDSFPSSAFRFFFGRALGVNALYFDR